MIRTRRALGVLVVGLCIASTAFRADADSAATRPARPFVFVMIDSKTERTLGPFPYDRSVLAHAVSRTAELKAKAVVLKFFLDRPRSDLGDRALAETMRQTKVVLEACLDPNETRPNELPQRFQFGAAEGAGGNMPAGERGIIPLPDLAASAHAVGFVDHKNLDRAPLIERYRGQYVKSLYTCCIELALEETARIVPGRDVVFGSKTISLDGAGQMPVRFPAKDDLQYISLVEFLDHKARHDVSDRVVIIGYDSDRLEVVETPMGKVRPHRLFCYALMSLYEQLR